MLYRIDGRQVKSITPTTIVQESLLEKDFEDWIEVAPEILGEPLLIVGRQVELDGAKDRIDLLALDTDARLVVIELKRHLLGGDEDLQPIRYAALLGRWSHEDVRRQAEGYWRTTGQSDRGTFAQAVESFCDADAEVNGDQRIILAGVEMSPRIGSVALWLRAHGVETQVVTVSLYLDGEQLLLQPQVVIPIPSEEGIAPPTAGGPSSDKPWKRDGMAWHLEQRCSAHTRPIVERFVGLIDAAEPEAHGPKWDRKYYVSWGLSRVGPTWVTSKLARTG
jgi:hypothetical protein